MAKSKNVINVKRTGDTEHSTSSLYMAKGIKVN